MKLGIARRARVLVLGGAVACGGFGATCAEAKKDVKWVIDQTQSACVVANLLKPTPEVAAICGIDAAVVPWLDVVLSAHRTVIAKVRGESCATAPVASTSAATK